MEGGEHGGRARGAGVQERVIWEPHKALRQGVVWKPLRGER